MVKYKNILELINFFDVFIFDAFGVFWNGVSPYKNILKTFENLKKNDKKIIILSNTTKVSKKQEEKYIKAGFLKNKHYDFLITAGEYTRYILENKLLSFNTKKDLKNYYVFGLPNEKLFENINFYTEVFDINKADFIYLSTFGITREEYETYSNDDKKYLVQLKETKDDTFRTTKFDIFLPKIKKIFDKIKLPCFSANPDLYAYDKIIGKDEEVKIITPGTLSKYLKEQGFEVKEFGKPLKEIYEFALSKINFKDKNRICMVGDTLSTDIKGANNIGIKSVLCIETGNTADLLNKGYKIDDLIKKESVKIDYIINKVAYND